MTDEELEKLIIDAFDLDRKGMELWREIAYEHDVEYLVYQEEKGRLYGEPKDERDALLKHFGSGTLGKPATFWFDQAVWEWKEKIKDRI